MSEAETNQISNNEVQRSKLMKNRRNRIRSKIVETENSCEETTNVPMQTTNVPTADGIKKYLKY